MHHLDGAARLDQEARGDEARDRAVEGLGIAGAIAQIGAAEAQARAAVAGEREQRGARLALRGRVEAGEDGVRLGGEDGAHAAELLVRGSAQRARLARAPPGRERHAHERQAAVPRAQLALHVGRDLAHRVDVYARELGGLGDDGAGRGHGRRADEAERVVEALAQRLDAEDGRGEVLAQRADHAHGRLRRDPRSVGEEGDEARAPRWIGLRDQLLELIEDERQAEAARLREGRRLARCGAREIG